MLYYFQLMQELNTTIEIPRSSTTRKRTADEMEGIEAGTSAIKKRLATFDSVRNDSTLPNSSSSIEKSEDFTSEVLKKLTILESEVTLLKSELEMQVHSNKNFSIHRIIEMQSNLDFMKTKLINLQNQTYLYYDNMLQTFEDELNLPSVQPTEIEESTMFSIFHRIVMMEATFGKLFSCLMEIHSSNSSENLGMDEN